MTFPFLLVIPAILIKEPFGFIAIGVPSAVLLSRIKPYYFTLVLLPYALHILLDYLTIHEVSPSGPFSKKSVSVGFIKPFPVPEWFKKRKELSENW